MSEANQRSGSTASRRPPLANLWLPLDPAIPPAWLLPAALAFALLALVLVTWRYSPPEAVMSPERPDDFSAGRALACLGRLLPESRPHPVGSLENARLRSRLLGELRQLGLEPRIERAFICGRYGTCANVENVVTLLPGGSSSDLVALVAHYDSVGASPGAGDDLSGVATVLEVARILLSRPEPNHGVLLLFTDGEEMGLLGARAFAQRSAFRERVRAAINVDARGASGPSLVFEVTPSQPATLRRLVTPRPIASTWLTEARRLLRVDTDLTELRELGIVGYELAFIGSPWSYHTPRDELRRLDPRSVQHQGENTLGLVRALDAGPLPSRTPGDDAVALDLLAWRVLPVRKPWLSALALLSMALLTGATVQLARTRRLSPNGLAAGLVVHPLVWFLSAILGLLLEWLLRSQDALPAQWTASGAIVVWGCWTLALLAISLTAPLVRRIGAAEHCVALWLWVGLLGLSTSAFLPGVGALGVGPSVAAVAVSLGWLLRDHARPPWAALLVPGSVGALCWLPLALMLYEGVGLVPLLVFSSVAALVLSGLAPTLPAVPRGWRWVLPAVAAGLLLHCVVQSLVHPRFSHVVPRASNLAYHQHHADRASWLVDTSWAPPWPELLQGWRLGPQEPNEAWLGATLHTRAMPAPNLRIRPPRWEVLEPGAPLPQGRRVTARVTSRRGAPILSLHLPAASPSPVVRFDGELVPGVLRGSSWVFVHATVPEGGFRADIVIQGDEPLSGLLVDLSPGLPAVGRPLLEARSSSVQPVHLGDGTVASTPVRL